MADFARDPSGFRYLFGGMKLNDTPDSLPANKYALAFNVRAISTQSVRTRPGQTEQFTTGGRPITDLRAYSSLGASDNLPRILARDPSSSIYLDTGVKVGQLNGGGFSSPGVSMIPARPNASPNPYMYIADGLDYKKYSAPDATNAVTETQAGIPEPQSPPIVGPQAGQLALIASLLATPTPGGTMGAISSGARITDTFSTFFPDPSGNGYFSIPVSQSVQYQKFMLVNLTFSLAPFVRAALVNDVFPPLPSNLSILGIYYFSGTTGRCVVVPAGLGESAGISEQSVNAATYLNDLRRGALVKIGSEICLVLSVTLGPNGSVCFETSTTGAHTTADTLSGVPAIITTTVSGTTLGSTQYSAAVTTGIGTATEAVVSNPFIFGGGSYQDDDYIHFSINIDNLANLNEAKLLIDVGDGSFTQNFYYYTIRPSDIAAAVANSLTQLAAAQIVSQNEAIDEELTAQEAIPAKPAKGIRKILGSAGTPAQETTVTGDQTVPGSSQWSEIVFPISALTRVGNDQTRTLQNTNSWQLLVNANATVNVKFGSIYVMGGGQPDVGDAGAPYQYRVRPRSSITGAVGNPSPATRYGINPRRQPVLVTTPAAPLTIAEIDMDTWDVFRFGGTITEWRYIGQVAASAGASSQFIDNYGDDAATAGDVLDFDNFEPWPTIAPPHFATASVIGTTALVDITGDPDGGENMLRLLPGTLVLIGGQNAYTVWTRPTLVIATTYLFQLLENAGTGTNLPVVIQEPNLARQTLAYMWGPDASGTVFAVGDSFRPGTLYFSKNYAPDQAPDSYNIEITSPTEPLLGGETIDGLAFVASTDRWWALYPQQGNDAQRYAYVQQPFTRGLAAPFGHCTDGKSIFWWAKDSIQSSSAGSLTDADLYNLFPHDGVPGVPVTYNGVTINPPDYARTGAMRLSYCNSYLYAVYQDSSAAYWNLVLDTRTGAWSVDAYTPKVSAFYHQEQQAGTITATPAALYDELFMGTITGAVAAQTPNANDIGGPISGLLATREYDGGDNRAPKQWGDFFLDSRPEAAAGLIVTPMSLGAPAASPTTIPSSTSRQRSPISVGGIVVSDFMGILATWTDNFTQQALPTRLYIWQPSFVVQPARTISWQTFGTAYGNQGFMHIREIEVAWVSTQPITLAIAVVDGTAPATITIPSSGGVYKKALFPLTFNKGQLYNFHATSSAPFQFFLEDFEIRVGAWARQDAYKIQRHFGGQNVSPATI